jgi:hypothetical protein
MGSQLPQTRWTIKKDTVLEGGAGGREEAVLTSCTFFAIVIKTGIY